MKTRRYNFHDFMQEQHLKKVNPPIEALPLIAAPFIPIKTFAEENIQTKMMNAFDPLIGLIQGMAYPIAMVVVLGGALFVMIGNNEKGFGMMQKAGLGYVIVMIAPMILNVLVDAMESVA